jgi:hypothetical protein
MASDTDAAIVMVVMQELDLLNGLVTFVAAARLLGLVVLEKVLQSRGNSVIEELGFDGSMSELVEAGVFGNHPVHG